MNYTVIMKKKIYLSIVFFGFALAGFSQEGSGKIKKAEQDFENFSFDKAIERYEDSQDSSIILQRHLATSYFRTGDLVKAEDVYAKVASMDDANAEDAYAYAFILKKNSKYTDAEKWMNKFAKLSPEDSRAKGYLKSKGAYSFLQKDKGQFVIKDLDINSAQEDFSPIYYKDKVLFASSREGVKPIRRKWNWNHLAFLDIYQADKADDNELSVPRVFGKKINKKYHEGPVCFNADETKMYFTRNNYKGKSADGTIKLQLFTSELTEKGKWAKPVSFPYNSNEYSVGHASVTEDGQWMYFASDMPGGKGGVDIYKVALQEGNTYGEPINLGDKINTEGNEMFPTIHEDGKLFFASNGLVGLGGLDVFIAQIKADESIGKVQNLGVPINSSKDDFSFILNKESKAGYFASNREGGKGDDDIYSFQMLKPFTFGKLIKGIAKDKKGNVVAGAVINLYNEQGEEIETAIADQEGGYEFAVDADKKFRLSGNKEEYFEGDNTANTKTDKAVVISDLELEKDPGLSLYALITDKKTGEPLETVSLTLVDNMTGRVEKITTPTTGDYRKALSDKKLNDRGSYNLILQKEGYFTKTVTYNTEFDHEGQYDIHANLDLSLDPLVKNLSELIQINPINFDYNKFFIREDASVELDKIVEVMNKYPHMVIELGSHTDARGSNAYNEKLSTRRANASATYIKKHITDPKRIYGKGYGENKVINRCVDGVKCSDKEHEVNRRTEFKVISTGNDKVKVHNTSTDSFEK